MLRSIPETVLPVIPEQIYSLLFHLAVTGCCPVLSSGVRINQSHLIGFIEKLKSFVVTAVFIRQRHDGIVIAKKNGFLYLLSEPVCQQIGIFNTAAVPILPHGNCKCFISCRIGGIFFLHIRQHIQQIICGFQFRAAQPFIQIPRHSGCA